MAKKLNKDGLPEDVPTIIPDKGSDLFRDLNLGQDDESLRIPDDPPTRIAQGNMPPNAGSGVEPSTGEPLTKVIIRSGPSSKAHESLKTPNISSNLPSDPVVGWLVIIDGPGKGVSCQLGSGQNTVGRGMQARVRIDFGDDEISRDSQTIITYDPKHNKYYIQPGMGTNLTYLEGEPVLSPTPLSSGSKIVTGSTTLRFIAFCDEQFTWSD
ncbi:MAG: FHA domain-containing protein [Bacteroidetes bacterium]|nr:FHA domain-containing protein [Bacteroidota bacterium]